MKYLVKGAECDDGGGDDDDGPRGGTVCTSEPSLNCFPYFPRPGPGEAA